MGYLPRRVVYNFQALPEAWLNGSGDVHHSFANPCLSATDCNQHQKPELCADEDECEECCPGWWLRTSDGQLVRWTKVDQGGTNRLPVIKQAPIH